MTKIKNILYLFLGGMLLTSCYFGDNPSNSKNLTGNFYLTWFDSEIDQNIIYSTEKNQTTAQPVVEKSVFAIGFNEDFIIAKQHPDKSTEIQNRLYDAHSRNSKEDYEVKNLDDTIYLSKEDKVYKENGKWFHTGQDFTSLPDSLKIYKRITYYHIIHTKKTNGGLPYTIYTYENEKAYKEKRIVLGVPKNLDFTIINKNLE